MRWASCGTIGEAGPDGAGDGARGIAAVAAAAAVLAPPGTSLPPPAGDAEGFTTGGVSVEDELLENKPMVNPVPCYPLPPRVTPPAASDAWLPASRRGRSGSC